MSKIPHRLQSVLDYAASKHAEWAAGAESKRKKEQEDREEREREAKKTLTPHVETLLAYLSDNMEQWKPTSASSYDLGNGYLERRVVLADLPDGGAFQTAWNGGTAGAIVDAVQAAEPLLSFHRWADEYIIFILRQPPKECMPAVPTV